MFAAADDESDRIWELAVKNVIDILKMAIGAYKLGINMDTGKSLSEVLIYSSINPKYSIPLLGRFTLKIHQSYINRTPLERQLTHIVLSKFFYQIK